MLGCVKRVFLTVQIALMLFYKTYNDDYMVLLRDVADEP